MGTLEQFFKYFKEVYVKGTIEYINQKEGKKGPYVTVGLEGGGEDAVPLIVRSESLISQLAEGNTYEFEVTQSGIFTNVTGLKLVEGEAPKPGEAAKPGSYKSEFQKRKHPVDQAVIAVQAFAKSLIEAYGRVWATDPKQFVNREEFNKAVRDDTAKYLQWITETVDGMEE
jgi:hypothetical protein